jgi:endonuclease/exonuclease/phosphatase (EEP) superfamily protein YafD
MIIEMSLFVWNVHGVPLIGSSPTQVAAQVRGLDYDINLLQEVWTKSRAELLSPPKSVAVKLIGSGLVSTFKTTTPNILATYDIRFKETTLSRYDWLVRKGATFVVNTDWVLFVNTHLDAGRDLESVVVRAKQLDHIADELKKHHGPVVMVGDLNLKLDYREDAEVLIAFLNHTGLVVAAGGDGPDFILTRGAVTVTDVRRVDNPISDHKAIQAKISYDSMSNEDKEELVDEYN